MSRTRNTRKHWSRSTFVVMTTTRYDNAAPSEHGYCRECFADMSYYPPRPDGCIPVGIFHYKSHTAAARRGLWGKR